ncbi:MAG: proline dehydrogenase family protein [Phycisphaerales bacterium]
MSIFSRLWRGTPAAGSSATASPQAAAPQTAGATPADGDAAAFAGFDAELEARIHAIGHEYLERSRKNRAGLLSGAFWQDKLMDWTMKDEAFKVQLFRFVDCFPRLTTPEQVHDHLVDYLQQPGVTLPPFLATGLKAGGLLKGTMTRQVTSQIERMASNFIAGTDAASAAPLLEKLWRKRGIAFSVDLLGEACVSEAEAAGYQAKYLDLVRELPGRVQNWPANETLERDHLGPLPRTNVSVKISALHSETDPIATDAVIDALREKLRPILEAARDGGVFINFDMEQHSLKDLTLELFMRCCEDVDFQAGLAMQAYLRSGTDDAQRIIDWSKRTGRQVTVRLVKGAYWDYETIHAEEMGWPVPVWGKKIETDACFERMTRQFIESTPRTKDEGGVKLALGSHNARSIAAALALLERNGLPREALELQMLHGMGEELKTAAAEMGLRMREYVPVGEMIPGMAYLVRRLLENTSNESWLKAGFQDEAEVDTLLATPHQRAELITRPDAALERAPEHHALSDAVPGVGDGRPFDSCPIRDFSDDSTRQRFAAAVNAAEVASVPNNGTEADADAALATATAAFPGWRDRDPRERAAVLTRLATAMRARRDELSALLVREAGKGWRDADGEVAEAIDFCEYYARTGVPLFEPQRLGRFVGELDEVVHQPRGVCVVIAPWNFPLAILCGMTAAALVCGNPVIMKPAEQTPAIGRELHRMFLEAGCPPECVQLLAGPGETVGATLVRDPRTSIIAFTGSKAVGLNIIEAAGHTPEAQWHVKKVVCEMGGKNAVLIDDSADLDEAVLGVRASAFGFQGQKCSACSRVIVVDGSYDLFVERIVASTRALTIGDPRRPTTDVGPVIDEAAAAGIRQMIEAGKAECELALAMDLPPADQLMPGRAYVAPHIFTNVQAEHRIAREEIFGPVLAVMRARDFDHALELALDSPYRLTGGVFSRKPAHLTAARERFRVGNLYLNRGTTGALVARQPFGGFAMSGVGSKAGGSDYLTQFVEPRAICENTMRRGFAPGMNEA